mmetsp:Transcript_6904/g.21804  ORF Transcript_6904/g.21804 Transcript_6904/m.21804 type:complete len:206 (+) Transcript_6904:347-964(+)
MHPRLHRRAGDPLPRRRRPRHERPDPEPQRVCAYAAQSARRRRRRSLLRRAHRAGVAAGLVDGPVPRCARGRARAAPHARVARLQTEQVVDGRSRFDAHRRTLALRHRDAQLLCARLPRPLRGAHVCRRARYLLRELRVLFARGRHAVTLRIHTRRSVVLHRHDDHRRLRRRDAGHGPRQGGRVAVHGVRAGRHLPAHHDYWREF